MIAAVVVILIGLWIIVMIAAEKTVKTKDQSMWPLLAGLICLLLGTLIFGRLMVRNNAGKPIGEFHNNDIYQVVLVSPIVDDSQTIVLGLRKIKDGRAENLAAFPRIYPETYTDRALRIYRVPSILVEPIRRYHPPFEIKVFKTGDATSFSYHRSAKIEN
jgi:hypothetical protein